MSELASQLQARKARLQRFADAATRYQDKTRAVADIKQTAVLEHCLATSKPAKRRQYETANTQPVYAPITWRILRVVSEEFDMPVSEIIGRHQEPKYTTPRYVAIGLMLQLTDMSLPAIGRRLGGRDHTTIINAKRRIEELLEGEAFRNRFDQIKADIIA